MAKISIDLEAFKLVNYTGDVFNVLLPRELLIYLELPIKLDKNTNKLEKFGGKKIKGPV